MARTRRRIQPITDRIERIYEVVIWPDGSSDDAYDPFTVSLSWPAHKVPDDLYDDKIKRDALKLARKEVVKAGRLDADSPIVFALESIRFVRNRLIKAVDTYEAGAPRPTNETPRLAALLTTPTTFDTGERLTLRNGRFEKA